MITAFIIIVIHWIADFLLQTDKMAQGKSKNWKDLLDHTSLYSTVWVIPIIFLMGNGYTTLEYVTTALAFVGITMIAHTIQDYFTSRLNARLWEEKKIHWFFVSIGFDQVLHYGQLFLTYHLLIQSK